MRRGRGSLCGGGMEPVALPSPPGVQPSRVLVARGFGSPPAAFCLPSPNVRMFIKLQINLRPGDVQPGKHCADRVKGPSPARIMHPDGLIRAVRNNTRTSARGGAGNASQKTEANVSQALRREPGSARAAARRRGDAQGPVSPPAAPLDPAQRWDRGSRRRPRAPRLAWRQI